MKRNLKSDDQQLHRYQQNEQPNYWAHGIGNPGPGGQKWKRLMVVLVSCQTIRNLSDICIYSNWDLKSSFCSLESVRLPQS